MEKHPDMELNNTKVYKSIYDTRMSLKTEEA